MRVIRPAKARSPKPSSVAVAAWPTAQAHHIGRRHLGGDLDMAGVEQRQDLAVDRQRFALVGDALADHAVERRAPSASARFSCATSSCASETATIDALFSEVDRAWSAADCETMLREASVSLSARSRAVQRASARAASSADWRSLTLDCSSVVSKRASTWPLVTLSPSRTSTSARRPATRAFTMVWSIGWVVPVKRTVSTRPRGLMVCSSAAISSSGRSAGLARWCSLAAVRRALPFFQARAPPASTTAPARTAMRVLRLAFMAEAL